MIELILFWINTAINGFPIGNYLWNFVQSGKRIVNAKSFSYKGLGLVNKPTKSLNNKIELTQI
ncbi:MAG: hypothetical protein JWQ25_1173 [Daejeonella sp.]|nr:hypothetical protein [Daejeonella sp.]